MKVTQTQPMSVEQIAVTSDQTTTIIMKVRKLIEEGKLPDNELHSLE